MASKDFGAIETDYAFFMTHATEAASDVAQYLRELASFAKGRDAIRLLDFGCGTGEFTERLLAALNWSPELLRLSLLEPVDHQRAAAAERLAPFAQHPITGLDQLAAALSQFDLIVANHVLYYVEDLAATLDQLCGGLAPGGKLLLAIAGWENVLLHIWQVAFAMLGRPVPYFAADDVQTILTQREARFQVDVAPYQLRFVDTTENRLKILRFLLADHLAELPPHSLLGELDRYAVGGYIQVNTHSRHFVVEA